MGCCTSCVLVHRTRLRSAGSKSSCNRQSPGFWVWCSTALRWRRAPAATRTTTRTARSIASSALPRGLRIRRHRRPLWLGVLVVAVVGAMLGGVLTQASTTELLGALVVLLAIGTSFYRPAISLALLA